MSTPSLPEILVMLRAALAREYPWFVVGKELTVRGLDGQKMRLPLPPAMPVSAASAEAAPEEEEEYVPFIPGVFQKAILKALDGKALRVDKLGAAVGDKSRLYKHSGLKELRDRGLVNHHSRLGFYRPDKPPPELANGEETV
jgi:hypothetical protein